MATMNKEYFRSLLMEMPEKTPEGNPVIISGDDIDATFSSEHIKEGKIFFGFALADSMFAALGDCKIYRAVATPEYVKCLAEAGRLTPCLNPSHQATIDAMRSRYGIDIEIPETPPKVALERGDALLVMGVRGLPRLTDRHEYSEEEIATATFDFTMYVAF